MRGAKVSKELWITVVKQLSSELTEPFELEFVWRNTRNLSKLDWLNLMREEISAEDLSELTAICEQLKQHVPPQYLVGWAEFCDLKFKVNENVLIPRQETEELVCLILENTSAEKLNILDVGTGSGAIAISLAHTRPNWSVTASDLSEAALAVASENAKANQVKIECILSDVLSALTGRKFDLIVSNPPYIDWADQDEVDVSVMTYEPKSALFAENRGLAIYERLAKEAPQALTENGQIYLEIGYKQGQAVKSLFEHAFPDKEVMLHQDFFGKDRMVSVR
ncbi:MULTISPECIES: peptide chain release factor N(5)-glutamine methyltransferase [unclassified Lactococcus]|uniref:peptide chain release factor N(5)-glutamine methyltransferase n=1 Tax=unclassified Lactococcus TaxID=2643510 RepID=UPI0011CB3246|nr:MULTISPECIES: peptide chain release factor N(5)-glutamine methyltransferase [unclassified Lactococcus]MQW22385.1 peptide chain release factor N(5)-glutamine methyltransferase [Lactococcus sp. dk101]TXK45420.1 peptide chain release factor N(5)-glutamine methyltransferase [Lactococcus sp. dk310]TXK51753.1 peptide chain release factor N(5)-glutamine methyltransferase [Lactococcus sp. dk322]